MSLLLGNVLLDSEDDGRTTYRKRYGETVDGSMVPFGTKIVHKPSRRRTTTSSTSSERICWTDSFLAMCSERAMDDLFREARYGVTCFHFIPRAKKKRSGLTNPCVSCQLSLVRYEGQRAVPNLPTRSNFQLAVRDELEKYIGFVIENPQHVLKPC